MPTRPIIMQIRNCSKHLAALAVLSALAGGWAAPAHAGIIVGATRIIYHELDHEASVSIRDADTQPFVVQAWADGAAAKDAKAPFFVTPPLSRLDPGKQNVLRIMRAQGALPKDRESMSWLNVKEIPEAVSGKNVLQIAVRTRVKIFYRPDGLSGNPDDAPKQLQWRVSPAADGKGEILKVHNPTPYYVTFSEVHAGAGARMENLDKLEYVPPLSDAQATLTQATGKAPVQVNYSTINDFGAFSKPVTVHASS